jgi:hypothetical protein
MAWSEKIAAIKVGDRVCYSRQFLRSTGQVTGDIPFARGEVTELIALGSMTLAAIAWDQPDLPPRVAVANLARVTDKGIREQQ